MMRLTLILFVMMCVLASGTWAATITPPTSTPPTSTPTPTPTPTPPTSTPPAASPANDKTIEVILSLFPDFGDKRRIILESIQDIADVIDDRLERANTVFYEGSASFIVIFVAVYILYQAAKMLFPFFPLDRVSTALNASLTRILLAVTVTMFTASAMGPWNNLVAPVMVSGINYASELLFTAVCVVKTATPSGKASPLAVEGVTCSKEMTIEDLATATKDDLFLEFAKAISDNKAVVAPDKEPRLFNTTDPQTIGQSIQRLFGWIETSILTMVAGAMKAMIFGPDGLPGWDTLINLAPPVLLVLTLMCLALAVTGLMPYFTLGMRFVFFLFGSMILSIMVYFAAIALVIPAFTSFVGFWLRATLKLAVEVVMIAFAIAISLATMNEALLSFQNSSKDMIILPTHGLFITLWAIFFIMNMLVKSAKTLAGVLTSGGGKGLDLDAGVEMAERIEKEASQMIEAASQKGKEAAHFAYSK